MATPTVSAIVPAFNCEQTVGKCLEALRASTYALLEVIVVDDASADGTVAIAEKYGCTIVRMAANQGVGRCRDAGGRLASGEILFYTDADVCVLPDAVERGVEALGAHPGGAAVIGSYSRRCGAEGFASVYKQLVLHHIHQTSSERAYTFLGCCGLVKRDAFLSVGGFNSTVFNRVGEDIDFGVRLVRAGYGIWLEKGMQASHLKRYSVPGLLYNDMVHRAVPWTRFLLHHRILRFDLCTRQADLVSIVAAYAAVASLAMAPFSPVKALPVAGFLAACAVLLLANLGLLRLLWKERGARFALAGFSMRFLYYWTSALGALWAILGCLNPLERRVEPVLELEVAWGSRSRQQTQEKERDDGCRS